MNTVETLERLARATVNSSELEASFNAMNEDVKNAYIYNDMDKLKKTLAKNKLFANEIAVVAVNL